MKALKSIYSIIIVIYFSQVFSLIFKTGQNLDINMETNAQEQNKFTVNKNVPLLKKNPNPVPSPNVHNDSDRKYFSIKKFKRNEDVCFSHRFSAVAVEPTPSVIVLV